MQRVENLPEGPLEKNKALIKTLFRGLGQIMLQENAVTGCFFLAGIFYGSVVMGVATFIAVLVGTITAKILGYDSKNTAKGLYGFNAALVGAALSFYFEPVFVLWLILVIGAAMTVVLQHWFLARKISVFTLPFILITWLMMFLIQHVYPIGPSDLSKASIPVLSDFGIPFRGFGEVIFQSDLVAGILFLAGVLLNASIAALYGFTAALIAAAFAYWWDVPSETIQMGLFSYNAVLCAIVFAGKKTENLLWALIATILAVLIGYRMSNYQLVQLTFPFVAATVITLFLKKITTSFPNKTGIS